MFLDLFLVIILALIIIPALWKSTHFKKDEVHEEWDGLPFHGGRLRKKKNGKWID